MTRDELMQKFPKWCKVKVTAYYRAQFPKSAVRVGVVKGYGRDQIHVLIEGRKAPSPHHVSFWERA